MTATIWGGLLGGMAGIGLILVVTRIVVLRRPQLAVRVLPYVRDVPLRDQGPGLRPVSSSPTSAAAGIFGPSLRSAADLVERVLGGSASVRRRLERAGVDRTVQEFRIEQVVWGVVGFAAAAAISLLRALGGVGGVGSPVVLCALDVAFGVFARDNRLSTQVKNRERQVLTEFPTIAELLALSVAAGESPVSALDRVVRRGRGALSEDLSRMLAGVRRTAVSVSPSVARPVDRPDRRSLRHRHHGRDGSPAPRLPMCCTPAADVPQKPAGAC